MTSISIIYLQAFDCIWDALGFGENQEAGEIKLKLKRFKVAFGKTHTSRKTNFLKTANYIPAHRHKDKQIISMVNAKSLGDDFHGEDEKYVTAYLISWNVILNSIDGKNSIRKVMMKYFTK